VKQHALNKTSFVFTLVHLLIVQWPLVSQVLRKVDVTRMNGAYALFVIEHKNPNDNPEAKNNNNNFSFYCNSWILERRCLFCSQISKRTAENTG